MFQLELVVNSQKLFYTYQNRMNIIQNFLELVVSIVFFGVVLTKKIKHGKIKVDQPNSMNLLLLNLPT